jgi:hypothetical protein
VEPDAHSEEEARMPSEICPMHIDEQCEGVFLGDELGWSFTCSLKSHPEPGPYTWIREPKAPDLQALSGIAAELELDVKIVDILKQREGLWIEYGVLEHDFALAYPKDWAFLVDRYGHAAIAATQYSATSFLAGVLGRLGRAAVIDIIDGPATGRWGTDGIMKYKRLGYFALPPGPNKDSRLTCSDASVTAAYVPGQTEV